MKTTTKPKKTIWIRWLAGAATALALAGAAGAGGTVGKTLPADFPVIVDASLGKPVIGSSATSSA